MKYTGIMGKKGSQHLSRIMQLAVMYISLFCLLTMWSVYIRSLSKFYELPVLLASKYISRCSLALCSLKGLLPSLGINYNVCALSHKRLPNNETCTIDRRTIYCDILYRTVGGTSSYVQYLFNGNN